MPHSFPRFSEIRRHGQLAAWAWNPRHVADLVASRFTASLYMSQLTADFNSVPKTLEKLLGRGRKKLLVVAGFNGRFAKAIEKTGHDVLFTDANANWVKKAKKNGLRVTRANAALIETDETFDAWITYEGNEAFEGQSGILAMMRALSNSRQGLIYAKSSRNTDPYTPFLEFEKIEKTYGAKLKEKRAGPLVYYQLTAGSQEKMRITEDLNAVKQFDKDPKFRLYKETQTRLNKLLK